MTTLEDVLRRSEAGQRLTRAEALVAMDLGLDGGVVRRLLAAADRRMRAISGGRGRIWAAVGVDAMPCPRNCRFCSHGAAWGVYEEPFELSAAEVCAQVRRLAADRPDWVTLRFTQDYGIERVCGLGRTVGPLLPKGTVLVANTGEFSHAEAAALRQAGFGCVYHTYRLREGQDTGILPAERLQTLAAIRDTPGLALAALVEPVGPEHTDEEIVEAAFRLREYGVSLSGVMARVPVPGTPLASRGRAAEERILRAVAMTRLISGPEVGAICVHPPFPAAFQAGANTLVVECGAIPRDSEAESLAWKGLDMAGARALLTGAGFTVSPPGPSSAGEGTPAPPATCGREACAASVAVRTEGV